MPPNEYTGRGKEKPSSQAREVRLEVLDRGLDGSDCAHGPVVKAVTVTRVLLTDDMLWIIIRRVQEL